MSRLNRTLSKAISNNILLHDNRCFQNSYWSLRHVPGRATLVIGTARLFGYTVRHAWIEIGNTIIDPSWIGMMKKGDQPQYWPAHRYTKSQVRKLSIMKLGRVHREAMFSEWYRLEPTDE